jgi:hypothetical protein
MKITSKISIKEILDLAKKYPKIVRQEVLKTMEIVTARLEKEVVERTPMGVGGAAGLAGSVFGEVRSFGKKVTGIVGTPLEYGEVVEMGRRPGRAMPPVGPIALWAQRILGVPENESRSVGFAIARKIAVKGTKGARMFERAWQHMEGWAIAQFNEIPARVIKRL